MFFPIRPVSLAVTLLVFSPVQGGEPSRGQQMLANYFRLETSRIGRACLADVPTRVVWDKRRPELRRQFLDMMGLWPLPPRSDLKPVITGRIQAEHFQIEKIYFQSLPGLYVTANLYIPKLTRFPAPTVLYVCGHTQTVVNGVAYGAKVNYQHHPIWFAEHGYVCMILDTLELGELPGTHHGTSRLNQWWWQALGYTPAGVECWNAMRALDYLETRPEVDAKRFGVTGRSGGGATSWWLAAADDRVQCIVGVAGLADLQAHVVAGETPTYQDGVIAGHCDCMYFVNTYRWDFPQVAAMCAPRSLMLGNSTADLIFPAGGFHRIADKVKRIYDLYGATDHFTVLETAGPHKDTPELRLGAFGWMNRWLIGEKAPPTETEPARFTPQQLKVFDRLPEDAINATVQEVFVKPAAAPQIPEAPAVARAWWDGQRQEWLKGLEEKVFRGWSHEPPALDPTLVIDFEQSGRRIRAYDFASDEAFALRLWLVTPIQAVKPLTIELLIAGETEWQETTKRLVREFADFVEQKTEDKLPPDRFGTVTPGRAWAVLAPRGIGPSRWAEPGSVADIHIRRRFALLGQTVDSQRVWDIRRALAVLRGIKDLQGAGLALAGTGDLAIVALYAAIFEPDVARVELWSPPPSHRQGPIFLNVLRLLDTPQALALFFPRPLRLHVGRSDTKRNWDWPLRLQAVLGQKSLEIIE